MELYSYQKELVNSKSNKILMNWCRGAGSDTALAVYILENKPQNVLLYGNEWDYESLLKSIKYLSNDYKITINQKNSMDYIITFTLTDKPIVLTIIDGLSMSGKFKYDLVINKRYWREIKEELFSKYILSITKNNFEIRGYENFEKIIVDHRIMLKENICNLDSVLQSALDGKLFYREYAIQDKPSNSEINFSEFQEKALQKLQKQFLSIDDTKDTVLTRKNIIEMIKDLKEMGIQ